MKRKIIMLKLSHELHTKFKIYCAENETNMTAKLIELIERELNES